MKIVLLTFLCLLFSFSAGAKKDIPLKYDIVCAGSGAQGTYLVQVSVYVDKSNMSVDMAKKAAVHGIIFRGFSGTQGCTSQKPIVRNATVAQQYADFFGTFFQINGEFLGYATLMDGSIQTTKVDKKEYRMTAILSVDKDRLRKALEDAGIVKGLSSGF